MKSASNSDALPTPTLEKDFAMPQSRRDFLRSSVAIVPVVSVPLTACHDRNADAAAESKTYGTYMPAFFNATEWAFVNAACDRLIPADNLGAGALTAGAPEFIDRQMQTPYGTGGLWYMHGPFRTDAPKEMGYQLRLVPRDIYSLGIKGVNDYCQRQFGTLFMALDQNVQNTVLKGLEKGSIALENLPATVFFELLLANTKEGFLSDPLYGGNRDMVGWKMMGFPGARGDFADWIDRPNEPYPLGPVSIEGLRG
jgi:gluconate 2-dehydrogenase gamma chain